MVKMGNKAVITGIGLVSALGLNPLETWTALLSRKSGIRTIEEFDVRGFECRTAAKVSGLGAVDLDLHPRDSRIMDTHAFMLMKCSQDAFRQAALDQASIPPEEVGFFAGIGMVDYNIEDLLPAVSKSIDASGDLDYEAFYAHGFQEIYPLWPLSMLNNISFCQVAINLGIEGENGVFSPHADSCVQAIAEAAQTVLEQKATAVLAGGVSEKVSPLSLARALLSGNLNTEDRNQEVKCRPFDKNRQGTILGEGGGMVVLESQSNAEKRNVPGLAAVAGHGNVFGKSDVFNCPTREAIAGSMLKAIEHAGLTPADIDVVIAHGDGTKEGDKNESEAIRQVFDEAANTVKVFASKGAIGHLLSGAPAVDVILGIQMIQNGIIPAIGGYTAGDDNLLGDLLCRWPIKKAPERILINAHSYEGQAASVIIESVKPKRPGA